MKRIYYILFFILYGIIGHSQTAGYLGKRLLIQGSFIIGSPNFSNEPQYYGPSSSIYNGNRLYFHKSYRFTSDIVLSNSRSLYLGYKSSEMGYLYDDYSFSGFYNNIAMLRVKSFDIGLKLHLGGNIAPLGKYFIVGLSRNLATVSDPRNLVVNTYYPFVKSQSHFTSIKLGFGTNYILRDILVLSGSIETDLMVSLNNTSQISNRWQKSSYMNLCLGIGALVF